MASPNAPGRSSVQVPTSPDMVFEDLEFFRCVLVIPPMDTDNVEKGEPDMARVNITDSTGSCGTIQLKAFALPVFLYVHTSFSPLARC